MKVLNRRRRQAVAHSVIRDPEEHTTMDREGAVRSVQAADLSMPAEELDAIWSPMHLERLARTYWKYLSRVTLGLIRVAYTNTERAVVLVTRPFVLLRFQAPEYEMDAQHGVVRWRIRDGILVASRGHEGDGFLRIGIERLTAGDEDPGRARAHVEVEIASFYPAIASRLSRFVYSQTQSRIHVLVTHGFLRSLARLELEESAVGRFKDRGPGTGPVVVRPEPRPHRMTGVRESRDGTVTVGDTPWAAIAALAGGAALAAGLVVLARRR
jgi:hypothetical protein